MLVLAGGAGWLGTPEEAEITIGSSSLSLCQLTVRSLLLSFPSHSHKSSSPADTEPSCSHIGLTRGRAEPRPLTQAAAASQEQRSAHLQHLPGGHNAVQAGEGTALLHVAKSQLPQATSFCAPWTWGQALPEELWFRRGIESKTSQDRDAAVPLFQRCCCLSCLPVPWPWAAARGSTKARSITQDAEETANEQWKGRNRRCLPQCPSPAAGSRPSPKQRCCSGLGW